MNAIFSTGLAGIAALPQDAAIHRGEVSMSAAVQMPTRRNMTEAEWKARCDLAALYVIFVLFNLSYTFN
jgi:hypothetical protein